MPAYYNPYTYAYPTVSYTAYNPYNLPVMQQAPQQQTPYMINVDGEAAAKSWQPQTQPQPNSIVPLFDLDGQHVYFKSYDNFGRMNPIRKGRIVFDDEIQQSETVAPVQIPDMKQYVTKEDLKQEIQSLRQSLQQNQNNQNRSNNRSDR